MRVYYVQIFGVRIFASDKILYCYLNMKGDEKIILFWNSIIVSHDIKKKKTLTDNIINNMFSSYLLSGKWFIHAEMLAVQYSERKIHVNTNRLGDALPHQIRTQHLVGTRKRDGPFLVAARKFLGRNIPVRVTGYQFGHHKCKHMSLNAIRQLDQPV